jgi:hypothetical protein
MCLMPKENHVTNLTFILILFLSKIPEMDFREMGWGGMDWLNLAQEKDSCEHGNETSGSIKRWKTLA